MTPPRADVIVLGSGPAGLAAAAACAERGLRVDVVAPEPDARWTNRYGAWRDELDAAGVGGCAEVTFPVAMVHTVEGSHPLPRPYARVSNDALQGLLRSRLDGSGGQVVRGAAVGADAHRHGVTLTLADGTKRVGRVVVDATGHGSRLLETPGAPRAWQVAYGLLVEADGWSEDRSRMVLMDLRPAEPGGPASFLYAMPLADGRLFVEETSLAAAPAVDLALLERRLDARLSRMGVRVRAVHEVERCRIPMDTPLPRMPQRIVGFGGAAAMVHPATGYLLTRALAAAPRLAAALDEGLRTSPEAASVSGWEAVWPASERRTRALHDFGLRLLLGLDAEGTARFFDRFFRLPERRWRAYLSASAGPMAVASAMSSLFLRLDASSRRQILGLAFSAEGRAAARHLVTDTGGLR